MASLMTHQSTSRPGGRGGDPRLAGYDAAKLENGAMFMVGLLGAVPILRRGYRRLITRNPKHRKLLVFWIAADAFVGIQLAWVLRPFIGNPHMGVSFFRDQAWGNAYMEVIDSFTDIFERMR